MEIAEYAIPDAIIEDEIRRFLNSLDVARKQLQEIRQQIPPTTPGDLTAFIDTHLLMLQDVTFTEAPVQLIRARKCNAEWALKIQMCIRDSNKRIRLILHLARMEDINPPAESRLQGLRDTRAILGVSIPVITLPIAPGRNLAVLVECAVRDHILRLNGYHAEQDMMERMEKVMARTVPCE